nr:hypothetical protein [Trichococcus flocculiformis]
MGLVLLLVEHWLDD